MVGLFLYANCGNGVLLVKVSLLVFFFNGCLLIIDHPKVFFSGFCDRLKIHFIISRPSVQPGRVYFSFSSYLKLKLKMKFVA